VIWPLRWAVDSECWRVGMSVCFASLLRRGSCLVQTYFVQWSFLAVSFFSF